MYFQFMSARNFSLSRFGAVDETSATGLFLAEISYDYQVDKTEVKNHINATVGFSLSDPRTEIKISGVIATQTAGMTPSIASVLTLANSSANTLGLNTKGIYGTPVANAGVVVYGASMKRVNSDFETGDISAIFHPMTAVNAPISLT
jgi:hypothetical protein